MRLLIAVGLALVAVVLLPASQALGRQSAPLIFNATPRERRAMALQRVLDAGQTSNASAWEARSFRGGSSSSHVLRAILAL